MYAKKKNLFWNLNDLSDHLSIRLDLREAERHALNLVLPVGRIDEWDTVQAQPWETRTVLYDDVLLFRYSAARDTIAHTCRHLDRRMSVME